MESDKYNLNRFIVAQERDFSIALNELKEGRKRSHRMWYIFPQLRHLGHSNISKFYGLSGTEEAEAYLASNDVFARVLDKYFRGQRDNRTIRIIKGAEKNNIIQKVILIMKKLLYVLIGLIGGGTIYAATTLLSKSNPIEKAEKLFQQGDTVKALKILETAGNKGDIASCRYLYHYYDSIYDAPNDAYAEVEEVITPEGDWIWYGDPDQKPSGARLPSAEEVVAEEVVDSVICVDDSLPENDIPIQWYWLRRAAEFGDAESQCEYGEVAQFALGTDSAMVWWEKSALQDFPRGVLFYGNELYNQAAEQRSQTIGLKAFQMLSKAYSFGKELPSAGWHLGLCYMNAVGTHQDTERGLECLRQSAKYGYPEAILQMSELGLEDSPYWESLARKEGLK